MVYMLDDNCETIPYSYDHGSPQGKQLITESEHIRRYVLCLLSPAPRSNVDVE